MVTGARGQRLYSRKTVQFASNEFGFRNGIRQSDGTAQRVASFIEPVQFFEQCRPSSMRVRFQRLRIPNPDSNSTRRPHRSHCADLVICGESQVWGTRSARSRMAPNVPQKSCGCRWTSSDVPGTSEDANRLRKPKLQPLAGCLWTLLDVYGRLWTSSDGSPGRIRSRS